MTHLHLFITFALLVAAMALLPGPNIALITANSISHGVRYGLLTVAGSSSAMILQLTVAGLGLTGLFSVLGEWSEWIRLPGAAYLIYLGATLWRAPAAGPSRAMVGPKSGRIYLQAFLVCLTNPSVLLFYAAFFPQFMISASNYTSQMPVLCVTFLIIAMSAESGWALAVGGARRVFVSRRRLANRISGGLLIAAGAAGFYFFLSGYNP